MQTALQLFADILHTAEVLGPGRGTALMLQSAAVPAKVMEKHGPDWDAAISIAKSRKGVTIQAIAGAVNGSRPRLMSLAATGKIITDAAEPVKGVRTEIFMGGLSVLAKRVEQAKAEVTEGADPREAFLAITKTTEQIRHGAGDESYGIDVATVMTQGLAAAHDVATKGVVADIRSGVHSLDGALGGGLRRGALHVFGFRTSDGKTTLGVQQAIVNANAGRRVLLISLEMDAATLGERFLVHETQRPWSSLTHHDSAVTLKAYAAARDKWLTVKDQIISVPDISLDVRGIRMAMVDAETRYGKVDVIIVDHAQIVETDQLAKGGRYQEVGNIAKDLFKLAKAENIAVILFSQLNPVDPVIVAQKKKLMKQGVDPYEPSWADLRESRDLAMHAFSIVLGWTAWNDDHPSGSFFKVEKNRQGKRGAKVQVTYKPWLFTFGDYEQPIQGEDEQFA